MDIWQAIQHVNEIGSDKNQLRYDARREKHYAMTGVQSAYYKPKTVLDVGSGYGTMSFIMAEAGMKVTALDSKEKHNPKLFDKVSFLKRNIETQSVEGKFDLVLMLDVLEHLNYNPLPVMKKLHKVCQKGIIITTPARELDYTADGRWSDYVSWRMIPKYKNYEYQDKVHHSYTRDDLVDLLRESGFEPEYIQLMPVEQEWFIAAKKI